jgi:tRNA pseudouridine55 synthase
LRRVTKIKQIGHTGTLDPFAEGVLPVCIGKSTRLIEYLADDKAYIATVQFGCSTTTYDIEGEISNTSDKKVLLEELQNQISNFVGEIEQLPPIYSAIKVNGKKLYEYARNGETVEIKSRRVVISKLMVLGFDYEKQTAEILVECSKGTYIRSLANDLGEALASYGHLIKLVRVKAGDFELEKTIKLEDIHTTEDVEKALLNPINYLNYPNYELSEKEKNLVSNGMGINVNLSDGNVVLTQQEKILAIASVKNGKAKISKVFI